MRQHRVSIGLTVVLASWCLLAFSCANFTRDAYRTLTLGQQSYDATLSAMGDLYREGKVTETQKDKAIELGRAYKLAHNGAVEALTVYEEQGGSDNKDAYLKAAEAASKALANLLAYCRGILEGGS